jgi:hypothetical protein
MLHGNTQLYVLFISISFVNNPVNYSIPSLLFEVSGCSRPVSGCHPYGFHDKMHISVHHFLYLCGYVPTAIKLITNVCMPVLELYVNVI